MGEREMSVGYGWEIQKERNHLEDIGELIILGWILERWYGVMWTGLI
jgi:hypothetical protein